MTPQGNGRSDLIRRNGHVYITQAEASAILAVTSRTVRNMISDGRLRAYRLGPRVIRLKLDEVEAALEPVSGAL